MIQQQMIKKSQQMMMNRSNRSVNDDCCDIEFDENQIQKRLDKQTFDNRKDARIKEYT